MTRIKSDKTIQPLDIPPRVITATIAPETIRLPKVGQRDPYFGLSRSALNLLILPSKANKHSPPVKSFVIRQRGSKTGIRLISFSSLRTFVYAHAEIGGQSEVKPESATT